MKTVTISTAAPLTAAISTTSGIEVIQKMGWSPPQRKSDGAAIDTSGAGLCT